MLGGVRVRFGEEEGRPCGSGRVQRTEWVNVCSRHRRHTRGAGVACAALCLCDDTVEDRTGAVKCPYVSERHGDVKSETLCEVE